MNQVRPDTVMNATVRLLHIAPRLWAECIVMNLPNRPEYAADPRSRFGRLVRDAAEAVDALRREMGWES